MTASLDDIRTAMLALKPVGPEGFEGLLATVFSKITGRDFRLAKSGLQSGRDGATLATESNHISFEAKRYDSKLNDNDVLAKITSLIGSNAPPDVWILGATVEVSTQLSNDMKSALTKNGIGLLVLDWPHASIAPPLAAACVFAIDETCAFLKAHVSDPVCVQKAEAAFTAIRQLEAFRAKADDLVRELQEASLAEANARAANAKWHEASFADRSRAKARFGQILAPNAVGPLPLRQRSSLVQQIHQHLTTASSPKIVALVGGEGCGKSWLAAQSWREFNHKPILLLIPATDLKSFYPDGNFTSFLIEKLFKQTDERIDAEISRKRWERRMQRWREQPNEATPRFILCVDGLNQRPDFNWSRWLEEAAAMVVEELGGALIITVRKNYFDEHIHSAVHLNIDTVQVPEWTDTDLKEILAAKDIDDRKIKSKVFSRLKNPRLLGIAFDLLDRVAILDFDELSVERLLFEYIRIGVRDDNTVERPAQFSKWLAQHAKEIIDRVKKQQLDDRLIFERTEGQDPYILSADLHAVTAEHFFQPLPEDSSLYTLADDGLSLALGLSIIKALQRAERNAHNVADALDELIEPIAALDKTADAVFSGVMVSSIDEQCSPTIRCALICRFLGLQNIDVDNFPAFVAVVRNATDAAMLALVGLSVTMLRYTANKDWLSKALRECRHKAECWSVIGKHVSNWLCTYSLDPKPGVMSAQDQGGFDESTDEIERNKQAVKQNQAELSVAERIFLKKKMLECADYEPSLLWEEAFELLAGMPLAGFAEQFVACSFSHALNSSRHAPYYDKFLALIRFNSNDWQETREQLLKLSSFLTQNDTSSTGQWALVMILRSTSTVEDAEREEYLVEALTRDREYCCEWRIVEDFCATDPCDPASATPDNINRTAEHYEQADVGEMSRGLSMGREDPFVRKTLPGLARFRPEVAIEAQRKIARSIVVREASELTLGVRSLEQHCAALDSEVVRKLVEIANSFSVPCDLESRSSHDNWITSQYAILTAFPHLNGDTQLDILAGLPSHGPPLPKLAEVFKLAAPEELEQAMQQAMQSGERNRALTILMFARHSGTDLNDRSRILIGQFAEHEHSSVRAEAMDIIAHIKDADLIERIATSGWRANLLNPRENYYETWYGSLIVINAAAQGVICVDEALDRISPSLYGEAAEVLGNACHAEIASRLIAAAESALDFEFQFSPPPVEKNMDAAGGGIPPFLSLVSVKRSLETPENFEARHRRRWEAFNRFETELTKERACLIMKDVDLEMVDACVSVSPDHCVGFALDLLPLNDRKLMNIHNFALMLARSISHDDLTLSRRLFDRLSGRQALVNIVFGPSKIPLEAICIWECADGGAVNVLRTYRLDRAANDHQLAQEVLSALMAGKTKFLEEYARNNLKSPVPAANARALMVIGLGAESSVSEKFLNRYMDAKGFIGRAAKSARFAYERNKWAGYWFDKMSNTDSAEEFWALSVLFLKIVDARFDLWSRSRLGTGTAMPRFAPSIRSRFENRSKAWERKRKKTLFGEKVPSEVYTLFRIEQD